MAKVQWFKASNSLSEIYQKTGFLFSFVSPPSKGHEECHTAAKCRDFLHDIVRTNYTKKGFSIYRMSYDTSKNPTIDLNKIRILVSNSSLRSETSSNEKEIASFEKKMRTARNILNCIENHMGVSLTRIYRVTDNNRIGWLFVGNNIWLKSPYLVSLYTFLIRLGDKEFKFNNIEELEQEFFNLSKSKEYNDNDIQYIKSMWNKIIPIVTNYKDLLEGNKIDPDYNNTWSTESFHNYCGILSLCKGCTPSKTKNEWSKKLLETTKEV